MLKLKTEESRIKIDEYFEDEFVTKITGDVWLINQELQLGTIGRHLEEFMGRGDEYFLTEIGTFTTNISNSDFDLRNTARLILSSHMFEN